MEVDAPQRTRRLTRGVARLRRQRGADCEGEQVIRVPLGWRGRTYAYLCRGAHLGSLVVVDAPISGPTVTVVVGYGRKGYTGPLKYAQRVGA